MVQLAERPKHLRSVDFNGADSETPSSEHRIHHRGLQSHAKVLVIDDEADVRLLFTKQLESHGFRVETGASLADLKQQVYRQQYDIVLLDMYLEDGLGFEGLSEVVRVSPFTKIVILTGHDSVDLAVKAMNCGASGYVLKSEPPAAVIEKLKEVLTQKGCRTDNSQMHPEDLGLVGISKPMVTIAETIDRIKDVDSTVLICGESGTGKELIARAIHKASNRHRGPFIAINCAAIPGHLLEAELFGYKRGAFTDAKTDRKGFFETCSDGTLLLDEIGEMSPTLQAKLLRVLQEREVTPVGACHPIKVNTKVLASTNRRLEDEVREGRFREDLYYRLSVLRIDLPPLRDRKEDIPPLVEHFLKEFNQRFNKAVNPPPVNVVARIKSYDWPGNVRELHNAVERAVILAQIDQMQLEDLLPVRELKEKPHLAATDELPTDLSSLPISYLEAKRAFEKAYISGILRLAGGNIAEAARISGQYRPNIYRLIKRYDLDSSQFKE